MPIPNHVRQTIGSVFIIAGVLLPQIAQLEPTWKWVGIAIALVSALYTTFFTDSPGTAAEKKSLKEQVIRLTGSLASAPSERSPGDSRPPGPSGGGGLASVVMAIVCGGAIATGEAACTPAQSALLSSVESKVLEDIKAGLQAQQIEDDVALMLPVCQGLQGVCLVAVAVFNDALTVLVDLNVIPGNFLARVEAMRATERAKLHQLRGDVQ